MSWKWTPNHVSWSTELQPWKEGSVKRNSICSNIQKHTAIIKFHSLEAVRSEDGPHALQRHWDGVATVFLVQGNGAEHTGGTCFRSAFGRQTLPSAVIWSSSSGSFSAPPGRLNCVWCSSASAVQPEILEIRKQFLTSQSGQCYKLQRRPRHMPLEAFTAAEELSKSTSERPALIVCAVSIEQHRVELVCVTNSSSSTQMVTSC